MKTTPGPVARPFSAGVFLVCGMLLLIGPVWGGHRADRNSGTRKTPPTVSDEKPLDEKFKSLSDSDSDDAGLASATGESGDAKAPEKVDTQELALLRSKFKKQQEEEDKNYLRQAASETRDLKSANTQKIRAWEKQERDARHEYFDKVKHGPERRAYIKDFLIRRDALHLSAIEDEKKLRNEQEIRRVTFEEEQRERAKEAEEYFARSERPPETLLKR